jgi:hypothetical protein
MATGVIGLADAAEAAGDYGQSANGHTGWLGSPS